MTAYGWLAKRLGWGKRLSPTRLPVIECDTLDIASLRITSHVEGDIVAVECRLSCASYDGERRPITVLGRDTFSRESLRGTTRSDWARAVRALAIRCLTHELDEHLRVDGERAFDPHRNERRV